MEKEGIDEDETLLVGRRNEILWVWRVAQVKEECRHGYVVLLIRMGYKMLMVRRCAPQKEDYIEKEETLLVGRSAQKKEECRD